LSSLLVFMAIAGCFFGLRIAGNTTLGDCLFVSASFAGYVYIYCKNTKMLSFGLVGAVISGLAMLLLPSFFMVGEINLIMLKDSIQLGLYVGSAVVICFYAHHKSVEVQNILILVSIYVSVLAVIQYLILIFFDGYNIFEWISSFAGKDTWIKYYARSTATLQHFNQLMMVLIPGLVFSLFRHRYVVFIIISIGMLATGSRSAFLIIGATLPAYILLRPSKRSLRLVALGVILFGGFLLLNPDFVAKRFSFLVGGAMDHSTGTRVELMQAAWGKFLQNPWFGVGLGQMGPALGVDHVESSILLWLTELGIWGFGWLLVVWLTSTVIAFKSKQPDWALIIWLFLGVGVIQPFLVMSNVGPLFWICVIFPITSYFVKEPPKLTLDD